MRITFNRRTNPPYVTPQPRRNNGFHMEDVGYESASPLQLPRARRATVYPSAPPMSSAEDEDEFVYGKVRKALRKIGSVELVAFDHENGNALVTSAELPEVIRYALEGQDQEEGYSCFTRSNHAYISNLRSSSNFHGWSRNIKMALGAKLKLGFIVGSCVKPTSDHDDLQRWIRCDYMKLERDMVKVWSIGLSVRKRFKQDLSSNGRRENNKGNMNEIKGETKNEISFKKVCTNCGQEGHLFKQCFERLGYPNWYKGKKAKKNNRLSAHVNSSFDEHFSGETPFDMGFENEDLTTYRIMAVGKGSKNLYICKPTLDQATFDAQSLYEKLFGQPPMYYHLRVIGCLCDAAVTVAQKDDNRGIKWDVVFKEDVFPFKDSKKPKGSLFVHDFPSFRDEFYPETTQTPLPPGPAVVISNTHIPPKPDNENPDSSTNSIP
nr:heavy metal-associated domain, HMA [Tanacetum cinerariifolium]